MRPPSKLSTTRGWLRSEPGTLERCALFFWVNAAGDVLGSCFEGVRFPGGRQDEKLVGPHAWVGGWGECKMRGWWDHMPKQGSGATCCVGHSRMAQCCWFLACSAFASMVLSPWCFHSRNCPLCWQKHSDPTFVFTQCSQA